MKNIRKLLSLLLALLLALSLCAAAVFADDDEKTEEAVETEETAETEETVEAEEAVETEEAVEAEEAPLPDPETEEELVICSAGEVRSSVSGLVVCEEGGVVFNNGATVYNNGGVVYNNFGTVFANAGTTYNNSGVMYVNGGRAFNNAGTVYINPSDESAAPEAESAGEKEAAQEESDAQSAPEQAAAYPLHVSFAEDYSLFVEWSGLRLDGEGELLLDEGSSLTLRPMPRYRIAEALSSSGSFVEGEDGVWTLQDAGEDLRITLRVRPAAPEADLEAGVHAPGQTLTLRAGEGALIRYTLDGSEPDETSEQYSEPLTIDESCTLCARAYRGELEPGEPLTLSFTVPAVTIPEFAPLQEGYSRDEAAEAAVRVANSGDDEIRILSVSLAGEDADRFRLNTGEGGVIRADETREDIWTITPKLNIPAGEYKAELLLKLKGGESMTVPFSLRIEET